MKGEDGSRREGTDEEGHDGMMAYVWQESVCAMACDVVSCGWAAGGEAGNAIHRSSKTPPISLPEAWALTPNGKRSWRQRCGSGVAAHEETCVDLNLSSARATVSGSGTGGRQARPAWPGPVQSKDQGPGCHLQSGRSHPSGPPLGVPSNCQQSEPGPIRTARAPASGGSSLAPGQAGLGGWCVSCKARTVALGSSVKVAPASGLSIGDTPSGPSEVPWADTHLPWSPPCPGGFHRLAQWPGQKQRRRRRGGPAEVSEHSRPAQAAGYRDTQMV
ncbi:unnamed protein product [Clonostachys rhizophaga]|uniref:Uncharacterized protein n=1 Tax=Clonostachys rhizophaga TaxID=160324 RepID=A0A9N9VRP4_9HYPO|nr:unnamed protein product [Clonostachys rhizophaga]